MAKKSPTGNNWDELFTLFPGGYDIWKTAGEGEWFDPVAADRACLFFELFCTHVKGELAGQPFRLEPWQKAVTGATYGWKRKDGTRRFREVFIYVPRKNGKSTWCAGFALLGLSVDDEQGAEIYSVAAEREQAALVYEQAAIMAAKDEELSKRLMIHKRVISNPETHSTYKPISAEANTKHGFNTHMAIVDELHAQPTPELVEVIQTSVGSRRQPLIIYITTADYSRPSICNDLHEYASKVRDGMFQDSSLLPVIYEASVDDDWTDPKVWAKANPNLGTSVKLEYLERECRKAVENPSYENTFKRLHLNIRTEQAERWIQMHHWDACPSEAPPEDKLLKSHCFGAVDLSSTTDLTAFALYWPEFHYLRVICWLPEARYQEQRNQRMYGEWVRDGIVCITEGNAVDYEWVRTAVKTAAATYKIRDIGCDPWNASHFISQLQNEDGLPMVEFRQGFASMNEPSKRLERLVVERKLNHGGNRCLRWMISNVCADVDPAGNIKPSKKKSTQKIDGVVAGIMAIGRSMFAVNKVSVYEQRGLRIL